MAGDARFWEQTDKLVTYAKVQANGASDIGDVAQQFSDTAEDINGRMQDAVDQLEATARNAKMSIKTTQDVMRLDQRAWVGMVRGDVVPSLPLKASTEAIIMLYIGNTGRTPSLDTQMAVPWSGFGLTKAMHAPTSSTPPAISVLFPRA